MPVFTPPPTPPQKTNSVNVYVLPTLALVKGDISKVRARFYERLNNGDSYHVLPATRPVNAPTSAYRDAVHLVGNDVTYATDSSSMQL